MALDSPSQYTVDDQDCIPEFLDDSYQIEEDLARVWIRVVNDGHSLHLEDRIARTKMPYVNWAQLLGRADFQATIQRVEKEQRERNVPKNVFGARMHILSIVRPTKPPHASSPAAITPASPESQLRNTNIRIAIAFILGALTAGGLATKFTHTTTSTVQVDK